MTMEERFGDLTGLKVAWVGDGNNMANSWITAAMHLDFALHLACPPGYEPDAAILAQAQAQGARVYLGQDPIAAVAGAQVINTDVWASMGQEEEAAARQEVFKPYQVNSQLMKNAARGHRAPLPAGPPGRGDYRRGPGRPPIRGLGPGGKPPALPEGAAGMAVGVGVRGQGLGVREKNLVAQASQPVQNVGCVLRTNNGRRFFMVRETHPTWPTGVRRSCGGHCPPYVLTTEEKRPL